MSSFVVVLVEPEHPHNVGFVAWNLSNKAESSSLISSGCQKTEGFTLDDFSESGKWYMNHIGK